VVPHEFAAVDHLEDARRHVQRGMAVGVTGFQQKDASASLLYEPRRGDATRRTAADNDMIEGLRHLISLDAKGLSGNNHSIRHCERSEATQGVSKHGSLWVASLSLAMTTSRFI
jgi:hypothetical protein